MKEYKLSDWVVDRCIKYLKENGYLVEDKNYPTQLFWIAQ